MAVRIEKPQFNLRDKISSLDYIKLPKHKMPEGTVLQTQYVSTSAQNTYTDQHVEILSLKINKNKMANAVFVGGNVEYVHSNANGRFELQASVDDASSYYKIHAITGEDDNGVGSYATNNKPFFFLHDPFAVGGNDQEADTLYYRIYFHHHVQNGGTLYINRSISNSNTDFFPGSCSLWAMEIER
tara:strand:- start:9 stop:563 length:555 start_codon:yes stop_codon:yes gene_type:complete